MDANFNGLLEGTERVQFHELDGLEGVVLDGFLFWSE
jgi:hypothetical protein